MNKPLTRPDKIPFQLMQWFGWLSSIIIIGIAVAHAWLISSFLTSHLLQREGELTRDFVLNILVADGSMQHLVHPEDPLAAAKFNNTVDHIRNIQGLLRANIYQPDGTVLWSSDSEMIGKKFPDENEELEEALKGELVVNLAHISEWLLEKKEHAGIDPAVQYFVECYVPVKEPGTHKVIGVVEFYRAPVALTKALQEGRVYVWLTALVSALALFLALYWIVRKADKTIKQQHDRLIETETLAVVGELTASVAHNIRNPLSSIRSSAELALEMPHEDCSEQIRDIISEVDRIGKQVSDLLNYSTDNVGQTAKIDLVQVIEHSVLTHRPKFERGGQTIEFTHAAREPFVLADASLLEQVLQSLLSNASEAMAAGGRCKVSLNNEQEDSLRIEIQDNGCGIAPEVKNMMFRPFVTTKPQGLGLGLAQARKIIERFGGTIELRDNPGQGTTAIILLGRA